MTTDTLDDLQYLTPEERAELDAHILALRGSTPPSLADFVEATTRVSLDPWQRVLCARLQQLPQQTGQRLLIHAPPQHGKSIIVSQRFPAWLLGIDSLHRVKLACYNITHATGFSKITRDIMTLPRYEAMFPQREARLTKTSQQDSWFTVGRHEARDAQPSFKALGLVTGFVGQGADTLIIDDPYASPQDAMSEVIRNSTYMFWEESAKVRLTDKTNVVVMFHRYHEDDLAGRLMAREGLLHNGGTWEIMRFPAIADGDDDMPDPLQRQAGELLSPRYSRAYYAELEKSPAWLGQFQGRPTNREGAFFRVDRLEILPTFPIGLRLVRAWDLASSDNPSADYTVGVLIGVDREGFYWVLDVVREQAEPDRVRKVIGETAQRDGKGVKVWIPIDPGLAGKVQGQSLVRMLAGHTVKGERVSGSKVSRAEPFAAMLNAGNVKIVEGHWNRAFIEELRQFPLGANDDQVDAGSDAFSQLEPSARWYAGNETSEEWTPAEAGWNTGRRRG
jgi:predicted phage terminase large subunit-like protein